LRICFFNCFYFPDLGLGATGQLLTEIAEDLVRDYGCKASVVAGSPLMRGQAATAGFRDGIDPKTRGCDLGNVRGADKNPSNRFAVLGGSDSWSKVHE
jgi:hypothetical protein